MQRKEFTDALEIAIKAHKARIETLHAQIAEYEGKITALLEMRADSYVGDLFGAEASAHDAHKLPVKVSSHRIWRSSHVVFEDQPSLNTADYPKKSPSKEAMIWLRTLKDEGPLSIAALANLMDGDEGLNLKKVRAFANNYKARYGFLDRDGSGVLSITERGEDFLKRFDRGDFVFDPRDVDELQDEAENE